jgi:hypothetical protein
MNTSLQISIQRKRDRVKILKVKSDTHSEKTELRILEREIAEDEKLLPKERTQMIDFATRYRDPRLFVRVHIEDAFTKKYGSDE